MLLTNPVVISIVVLLALSLLRINVVIALVISALVAGLTGNLGVSETIKNVYEWTRRRCRSRHELCDFRRVCGCHFKIRHY